MWLKRKRLQQKHVYMYTFIHSEVKTIAEELHLAWQMLIKVLIPNVLLVSMSHLLWYHVVCTDIGHS